MYKATFLVANAILIDKKNSTDGLVNVGSVRNIQRLSCNRGPPFYLASSQLQPVLFPFFVFFCYFLFFFRPPRVIH